MLLNNLYNISFQNLLKNNITPQTILHVSFSNRMHIPTSILIIDIMILENHGIHRTQRRVFTLPSLRNIDTLPCIFYFSCWFIVMEDITSIMFFVLKKSLPMRIHVERCTWVDQPWIISKCALVYTKYRSPPFSQGLSLDPLILSTSFFIYNLSYNSQVYCISNISLYNFLDI